ncbi:uncharacterized protein BDFB_005045, partial [Asbolus verrucosus]
MRVISKIVSIYSNNVVKVDRIQFRNFAKALNQEYVTVLNQETLTGRILLYLNTDNEKFRNPSKNTLETLNTLRQNVNNLHRLNTHEIIHFSNSLINQNIPRHELLSILRELDAECHLRLHELGSADILKLLNAYMSIISNRITEFKFYKHSIKVLFDSLCSLDKTDLLQLIFYVGLKKKNSESQTMLRECLKAIDGDFINNLTTEELCIICNSTFKTSTKITNKILLNKVRTYINDNLFILKDSALFITLVKTLRHNRYQNDDVLSTISCATIFNKTIDSYSFSAICHIMALYADYFYYDEKLFRIFIKKCLKQLGESNFVSKDTYLTEQLRGKDIKRFLWVLSMFSEFKLVDTTDIKNVIVPKLIERIKGKEFENDNDSLVDIALYLWIINYRPYELVPYILNKQDAQLLDPDLLKKLPIKPTYIPNTVFSEYQLRKRPLIQQLLNTLNILMPKLNLNRFELTQEIPHLNIVGITGYRNKSEKAVYIEVLDDYTRIKNVEEDVPVGLMALKLRLLDRSEEGFLT